jgi:hypothetical protein
MFFFYVDESGHPKSKTQRFLVLAALAVSAKAWVELEADIIRWKARFFPNHRPEEVRIRVHDIRGRREPFDKLSARELDEFMEGVHRIMMTRIETLFAVALDAWKFRDQFGESVEPYECAYALLVKRINLFLDEQEELQNGIVLIDSRGSRPGYGPDERLAVFHNNLVHVQMNLLIEPSVKAVFDVVSSDSVSHVPNHILETLSFARSQFSTGLQLADLCAYNIFRAHERNNLHDWYFRQIAPKLYRGSDGQNPERGLVVFPPP